MRKQKKLSEYDIMILQLRELEERLRQARQDFMQADDVYVEAAIAEVNAAETMYNTQLHQIKCMYSYLNC